MDRLSTCGRRFLPVAALALATAACVPAARVAAPAPLAPPFSALDFFDGASRGEGQLHIVMSGTARVQVDSVGHREGDGTLVLAQIVRRDGKPETKREWRIRETAPGRYTGTLSDAAGPVIGEADGDRLHLRFAMRGGLRADQYLYLAPDRRSARNLMRVTKLGIVVACLDETIRKTA